MIEGIENTAHGWRARTGMVLLCARGSLSTLLLAMLRPTYTFRPTASGQQRRLCEDAMERLKRFALVTESRCRLSNEQQYDLF